MNTIWHLEKSIIILQQQHSQFACDIKYCEDMVVRKKLHRLASVLEIIISTVNQEIQAIIYAKSN